jgi:ribosome biogenesis GTPase / thiamine phosphate phosphatase
MVCAHDERAREETTVQSLETLGWNSYFEQQIGDDERERWVPARVVWEAREHYRLSTGSEEWQAQLTGRLRHEAAPRAGLPVVGDWVLASLRPAEGSATIHRTLVRRTQFSRGAAGRSATEQVIAANIDTILLVTSFNLDFNLRRIERYLALAWESGAVPVVVLNKADLCGDQERWRRETESVSQGVPILVTSALRGDGIADLRETIRASGTTTLLGSSGVGKSSLLNALVGDDRQGVLPVRGSDDRGRHSTTARQLFCLPSGGIVIDTPGMRELQIWDAEAGLEHAFADIEALAGDCRFRDCSHGGEPGCAVAAAVERGDLAEARVDSYHRLQREDAFLRSRHDESAVWERKAKAKQIGRAVRQMYKLRNR